MGFDPTLLPIIKFLILLVPAYFVLRGVWSFVKSLMQSDKHASRRPAKENYQELNGEHSGGDYDDVISRAKRLGGEKAATLMEYSDQATDAYKRVTLLPEDYHVQYFEHLQGFGVAAISDYADSLVEEYHKQREELVSPFERNECNEAYQQLLGISDDAASEFKRVIMLMGEGSDVPSIVEKIQQKFQPKRTPCGPYFIAHHNDGWFSIVNEDNNRVKGFGIYATVDEAINAIHSFQPRSSDIGVRRDDTRPKPSIDQLQKELEELKARADH